MNINIAKVVHNCVASKLAYHGFKYSEAKSHKPTGHYEFVRNYFGKQQRVSISRVQYDLEDISRLIAPGDDIPTEVPPESMLNREAGYRLWLSNRYIVAIVGHEYSALEVTRTGLADYAPFKQLADLPPDKADQALRQLRKKYLWCRFEDETELREVLDDIVRVVLTDGLDWFEEQVAEVKHLQDKLITRFKANKQRRERQR